MSIIASVFLCLKTINKIKLQISMTSFKKSSLTSSYLSQNERSRHFLGHLNKNWNLQNTSRYIYAVTGWKNILKESDSSKWSFQKPALSLLNGFLFQQIVLHSTSGKLFQSPKCSTICDLAFSTISCQSVVKVYSRKAIASFKLSKLSLLGAKTTLRSLTKLEFFYKFYFLGAAERSTFASINPQKEDTKTMPSGTARVLFPFDHSSFKTPFSQLLSKFSTQKLKAISWPGFSVCPAGRGLKTESAKKKLKKKLSIYKPSLNQKKDFLKLSSSTSTSLAVKNVFIFNELDSLGYDLFSNLVGFEITFVS